MIEAKLSDKLLDEFLNTLRKEDKKEIEAFENSAFQKDLLEISKNNEGYFYFLLSKSQKPLALGGAKPMNNPRIAKVWMLCTDELDKNRVQFYRYVTNKIEFFKSKFDVLYNFIYKSNFASLVWLKKCGFEEIALEDKDFRLFYFIKGGIDFDLRYFTCE